jgi:hypothetical protein
MKRAFQQHRGLGARNRRIPDKLARNSGQRESPVVSARRMLSSSRDGSQEPGRSPGCPVARRPASRKPA